MTGTRLIVALCLAEIVGMMGFGSFPALLPTFFAEWGLSNTEAGWLNGIYFGAYMVSVPVLVSLTDHTDPRRIYIVSMILTAISSIAFAWLAEGFWSALLFRALAGMGLAGTYMPGLKALTDHIGETQQSRAVAFYTASFSIGTAASFWFAGEIASAFDWRWAFALAALGPLVSIAIMLLLVPASHEHRINPPQAALLDFRPTLRNRQALAYVLAYCGHNWELFCLRSWMVAFLVFAQTLQPEDGFAVGWSATTIAAIVIILGLPSSVLGNEASRRFGRRPVVLAIMSLSAVIAALYGFAAPLPFILILLLSLVYGVTVTADSASITAGAIGAAKPGQRGATMAVHSFIGFAGAFLGPLVFGVVLDLAGGGASQLAWGLAFVSSGLGVALGVAALWFLTRPRKASAA